jgi:uncharacterized protein (TIGR00661 family)
MAPRKNILICPLDWGLGHATRCVPVIRRFQENGTNVIIAASGRPLSFLKKEYPQLSFIDFPGYNITYPKNGSMAAAMLRSAPSILQKIKLESIVLDKIISEHNIDIVISDNRFGLHSTKAYCVYITHQVLVKCPASLPFLEYSLYRKHRSYIKKYDECWIPDFRDDPGLSGILSHKYSAHRNTFFIGPLSRFSPLDNAEKFSAPIYDVIVILSGPEPQRSIFEGIVMRQAEVMKHLKFLFVSGITESESDSNIMPHIRKVSHFETEALRKAIIQSKLVVSRPGYSSIMDLAVLNKKAVFVPTPGQTEQEYLAKYYFKKNLFFCMRQNEFNLEEGILKSDSHPGLTVKTDHTMLQSRIDHLLKK